MKRNRSYVNFLNDEDKGPLAPLRRLKRNLVSRIEENEKMQKVLKSSTAFALGLCLITVLLFATVYYYRPVFHFMFWVYRGWPLLAGLVIAAVGTIRIKRWIWDEASSIGSFFARGALVIMVLLIPFVSYAVLMEPVTGVQILENVNETTLESPLANLDVRYIAYDVAQSIGNSMMADSRYNAGDVDPFDKDGNLSYSVPRVPNGHFNGYYGHANGIMLIETNPDRLQPKTRIIEQEFKYGEGMGWFATNNIYFQLYSRHWWCEVPEIYYAFVGDKLVQVAPYMEYDFRSLVFVPRWAGIFVIHGDGNIERLTKEQALSDSRFRDQRLFPEEMARQIAYSWQYRGGIWNAFTTHVDMAEVDNPSASDNQMPYLTPTPLGDAWVFAYKPAGSNTDAVYKIQYIDARNGDVRTYNVVGTGWIGPNKAIEIVKNLHKNWDWTTFNPVEALPIYTITGEFFWQVSIINVNSKLALVETVLIDGKTQDAYEFTTYRAIKKFLDTGAYTPLGNDAQGQSLDISQMSLPQLGGVMQKISERLINLSSTQG